MERALELLIPSLGEVLHEDNPSQQFTEKLLSLIVDVLVDDQERFQSAASAKKTADECVWNLAKRIRSSDCSDRDAFPGASPHWEQFLTNLNLLNFFCQVLSKESYLSDEVSTFPNVT